MTTAAIQRALTPTEKIYADVEMYVGYTVRTVGPLDPDALRAAYAAVCRAHPQLAARLEADDGGLVFVASGVPPEVQICAGDPGHPLTGVELDEYRMLSALNVVRDGAEASVTLLTHHSIADAHHSIELLAALWACYTDVVRGVPVDLPRRPYPRSLEDLLAERGIHRAASGAGDAAPLRTVTELPASARVPMVRHVVQHRLTAAETKALAELGHREGVTLNGLLSGAVLLVEAEVRGLPVAELLFRYTVNLRNRLDPPVGPTEGTNVVGGGLFKAADDVGPGAVALGRALGERLRAGLADGSIQRSLLDMVTQPAPHAKARPSGPAPAVVSVSNWGVVPPLRSPDGLLLANFHSSSRRKVAPGEFAAIGGYVATTFDGRIGVDLAWPEGDAELPERLGLLREGLGRLTSRS
ncbi:Phthiocerol/phthiodiolone dimycocerosyl transferase [Streptomyces sp. YIM 121038]|uniref:phthiocerol/phthiodiolone dimycocerosyl transferase family protein n=1 Tax=Streptomyces sp. YIM 121038 TaxID=2136401 RepID=UPI0011101B5B|nr:acyltransferase [Streptomyces sp. YIM 121038]QCX80454.1 Phthiocerol/phthiodiolone dimycocerosyl transferase [Streptomyces sp. YIM 121038]